MGVEYESLKYQLIHLHKTFKYFLITGSDYVSSIAKKKLRLMIRLQNRTSLCIGTFNNNASVSQHKNLILQMCSL